MHIQKKDEKLIYKTPWVRFYEDTVTFQNGDPGTWAHVWRHDSVTVIPMIDTNHVLVQKEWRYPAGKQFTGFTIGGIEHGQTPEEAAREELREEAGREAGELVYLGSHYVNPGFSSQINHIYVAKDLRPVETQGEAYEDITTESLEIGKLRELIASEMILDSFTIAGAARFFLWLD